MKAARLRMRSRDRLDRAEMDGRPAPVVERDPRRARTRGRKAQRISSLADAPQRRAGTDDAHDASLRTHGEAGGHVERHDGRRDDLERADAALHEQLVERGGGPHPAQGERKRAPLAGTEAERRVAVEPLVPAKHLAARLRAGIDAQDAAAEQVHRRRRGNRVARHRLERRVPFRHEDEKRRAAAQRLHEDVRAVSRDERVNGDALLVHRPLVGRDELRVERQRKRDLADLERGAGRIPHAHAPAQRLAALDAPLRLDAHRTAAAVRLGGQAGGFRPRAKQSDGPRRKGVHRLPRPPAGATEPHTHSAERGLGPARRFVQDEVQARRVIVVTDAGEKTGRQSRTRRETRAHSTERSVLPRRDPLTTPSRPRRHDSTSVRRLRAQERRARIRRPGAALCAFVRLTSAR